MKTSLPNKRKFFSLPGMAITSWSPAKLEQEKSRVVNVIRDDCRQHGLKVAVVCSSGIACQVYDRGVASIVHSYYGLGAARYAFRSTYRSCNKQRRSFGKTLKSRCSNLGGSKYVECSYPVKSDAVYLRTVLICM